MSGAYTGDGRRKSSMTHAKRGHQCEWCDRVCFGNGGNVAHARSHVRRGEAVELIKPDPFSASPRRVFLGIDDQDGLAWCRARGYEEAAA